MSEKLFYPNKPTPIGKCHECRKAFDFKASPKQIALWCNAQCKEKYYGWPTDEQLRDWTIFDGDCEATDGCRVEPDGKCQHGHPGWPRALGLM